jgi:exodeoxyribonuclease VII large subunit
MAREATAVCAGKLEALSPLATLARGYAIANRLPEGTVVRQSGQLAVGDRLNLRFFRGSARCLVESRDD